MSFESLLDDKLPLFGLDDAPIRRVLRTLMDEVQSLQKKADASEQRSIELEDMIKDLQGDVSSYQSSTTKTLESLQNNMERVDMEQKNMNSRMEAVGKSVEDVRQQVLHSGGAAGGTDSRRMSILQRRQSALIRQQSIRKMSFSGQTEAPSVSEMGVGCDLIGEEEAMRALQDSFEEDKQSEFGTEMGDEMRDEDEFFQLMENMQKQIQTLQEEITRLQSDLAAEKKERELEIKAATASMSPDVVAKIHGMEKNLKTVEEKQRTVQKEQIDRVQHVMDLASATLHMMGLEPTQVLRNVASSKDPHILFSSCPVIKMLQSKIDEKLSFSDVASWDSTLRELRVAVKKLEKNMENVPIRSEMEEMYASKDELSEVHQAHSDVAMLVDQTIDRLDHVFKSLDLKCDVSAMEQKADEQMVRNMVRQLSDKLQKKLEEAGFNEAEFDEKVKILESEMSTIQSDKASRYELESLRSAVEGAEEAARQSVALQKESSSSARYRCLACDREAQKMDTVPIEREPSGFPPQMSPPFRMMSPRTMTPRGRTAYYQTWLHWREVMRRRSITSLGGGFHSPSPMRGRDDDEWGIMTPMPTPTPPSRMRKNPRLMESRPRSSHAASGSRHSGQSVHVPKRFQRPSTSASTFTPSPALRTPRTSHRRRGQQQQQQSAKGANVDGGDDGITMSDLEKW